MTNKKVMPSKIPVLKKPQPATGQPQPATGQPQPATGQPQPATGKPQPATGQQQNINPFWWLPPQPQQQNVDDKNKLQPRNPVKPINKRHVGEYDYIPREKKIKSNYSNTIDRYTSGFFWTWFLRILFLLPIILSGIYISTKREGTENFNLVLSGLILYSIFGGYLFLDMIHERYRKYILLLGITIGSFIVFCIALSKDDKNGLMTSIVVITGIVLFIIFVYNVTLLQYSSSEILENSPTIGNYIIKLDSLRNAPGYNDLESEDKVEIEIYRSRLLKKLQESTKNKVSEYRDPVKNEYGELQGIFDRLDSEFLGENKMSGNARFPKKMEKLRGSTLSNDDYLLLYQTDRSIYKGFLESKKKK